MGRLSLLLQAFGEAADHGADVHEDARLAEFIAPARKGRKSGLSVVDSIDSLWQMQRRQRQWSSFLADSSQATAAPHTEAGNVADSSQVTVTAHTEAASAAKDATLVSTAKDATLAVDASKDHNGSSENSAAPSGVQLYNPENRHIFLVAMPITVAMAAFFECHAKERLSETNLSAPLPEVVQTAEKEEEASSLKSAFRVLDPYVRGPTALKCAGYGIAHFVLLGMSLYVDVALTQWNGVFWTALQNHQSAKFYSLLWDFVVITGVTGFVGTYSDYLNGMWHLHARDHLTRHFNQIWVGQGAMCIMQQCDSPVDNPDQRIDQDVDEFISSTRELFFGVISSAVKIGIYFPILVKSAPAPLLGFVVVWPVLGAFVTHRIGQSLIPLSLAGETATANFRSELVHIREKADSLALLQAGPHLEESVQSRFEIMKRVSYAEFDVAKVLNFFKMVYEEYGTVVPFVLLAPAYFSGSLDLGNLMQLRMIVERVSASLTFPVAAYEQAVGWRVAANRLAALQAQAMGVTGSVQYGDVPPSLPGSLLLAEDVGVLTPQGRPVLCGFGVRVDAAERVLVVIPAQGGKSLLTKTLAGVWSHMTGRIHTPKDCMFIQGFEFPPLTLHALLAFPKLPMEDVEPALRMAGMKALLTKDSSEVVRSWEDLLSLEEQQRLQIARVLLRRPQVAVLDEPLAGLGDEDACSLLRQLPQETSLLTFSRSRRLAPVHTRVVELDVSDAWVPSEGQSELSQHQSSPRPTTRNFSRPARLGKTQLFTAA
eukprot:TRINITY_DN106091_c0_g1_i1.p1 TRINITY_DN106091_c0_g1~~TRINITY_DN106091_c0_g1_i1.p1  ORF type:complete len:768 (-),score=158.80 TRINITY_DN106091_c0_g1_i1:62-2365(-)